MCQKTILPLLSKADKEVVFEKIFKNYHIVPVNSLDVFEVMYDTKTRLWMRKRISRSMVSENIIGYLIGRYIIIWKSGSEESLLVLESGSDWDCCLLSCGGFDFALRRINSEGMFIYQYYKYHPRKECYEVKDLGERQPENLGEPYQSQTHQWSRMWIRKEGIISADNIIFYDYIVRYWTD